MKTYNCTVTYLTAGGGCSWATISVEALSLSEATTIASEKIRRDKRRKVQRIISASAGLNTHTYLQGRFVMYGQNGQQVAK